MRRRQHPPESYTACTLGNMTDKKLESLAYRLRDLTSLRDLFSELNFDFEDKPVNKDSWKQDQKDKVTEARVIASKNNYQICYIRTNTNSLKDWKGISSRIIKDNSGLCMVCSHNPDGFKWVFSSLSKNFSQSFSETRHVPIDITGDSGVPKTFIDFLEALKIKGKSTTTSITTQISNAFDSFAVQIHDELTVNVFEALKILSEGIILDESNEMQLDEQLLEEIREPVFILLYRIIFVLYADDRGIFPIDNSTYHDEFSLKWIKHEWLLKGQDPKKIDEYGVQERLWRLFRLIEYGSEDLGYNPDKLFMKPYYGRLFDRQIHSRLEKYKIKNQYLLEAIGLLTRTRDKKGNYFFLDYSALETRHLGSIYERLLEYHLTVKDKKIAELPNPKDRKASGSYYTPQYIVDYIVENTVGPLIDHIIKTTAEPDEQVEKILDLNVLDPAMGSGHFLVGVTDYIARRICEIEFTGEIPEQVFVERKRDVARRCIYGVDLNPLAVDLAHVSLWLETLSSEKPLSFLSAHLKTGNSLVGANIDDIFAKQTTLMESAKGRTQFKKTVRDFIMLEQLEDDTAAAVKTKMAKYKKIQSKGTIYYQLKFLLDAKVAKNFGVEVPPLGDYVAKIGENSLDFFAEGSTWPEVKRVAEKHSFFHWDLEFPDIFHNDDGKRKKNPGFDAVVGNPPYGAKISKHEQKYYKERFSKVGSTDTAQLMMRASFDLLSKFGINGFIVPKALTFASNWKKIRMHLMTNLSTLIDCKKVWKDVKLEQVIYIYQNSHTRESYLTGSRIKHDLIAITKIDKNECTMFEFLISGLERNEITVGQKIHAKSEKLGKYITNNRGCMLQNKIRENGEVKVIGGAQIQRYYITKELKGYLNARDINDNKAYIQKNSILAQNIVAHVENPVDHLKITATIPHNARFIVLDTINQITVNMIDPYYILGFLNSKILNWYVYRFIFAKAIRTMHFDSTVTDRIPIIIDKKEQVIKRVKNLIRLHTKPSTLQRDKDILTEEDELNRLFYHIFGLTDDEIRMIESSTPS